MEQQAEEALEIQKHGIRASDFLAIHGDDQEDEPLRDMLEADQLDTDDAADEENMTTGLRSLKSNFFDGVVDSEDEDFEDD